MEDMSDGIDCEEDVNKEVVDFYVVTYDCICFGEVEVIDYDGVVVDEVT